MTLKIFKWLMLLFTLSVLASAQVSNPIDINSQTRGNLPFGRLASLQFSGNPPGVTSTFVNFPGTTVVGQSSAPATITVTNVGGATVVISSITDTTSNFTEVIGNSCTTLSPGVDCSVSITFTPTTSGILTDTLTIASSTPGVPNMTVALFGTGITTAPTWSSLAITPASPTVLVPNITQLTATVTLSAGAPVSTQAGVNWSISGGGSSPITLINGPGNLASYITAYNTTGSKTLGPVSNAIHNLLVVEIGSYYSGAGQTLTVTDTNGNSWSSISPVTTVGGTRVNQIFYTINNTTASNTITCNSSAGYFQCSAFEISGIATSSELDTSATGNGSSATMVTNNIVTTGSYDGIVGFCTDQGASTGTMAAGSGYTLDSTTISYPSMSAHQFGLAAGTYTLGGTDTTTPDSWLCMGAAFKGTGSTQFATISSGGALTPLATGTSTVIAQGGLVLPNFASGSFPSLGAGNTATVTYSSNQIPGDTNVVVISYPSATGTISSVTDKAGNTYSAGTKSQGNGNTTVIYIAGPIVQYGGNTANSVTVTFGQASTFVSVIVAEYSFTVASSIQDGGVVNNNTASATLSGTLTTSNAHDEVICGVGASVSVNATAAPFTIETSSPFGVVLIDAPAFSAAVYTSSSTYSGAGAAQQCLALKVVANTDSVAIDPPTVSHTYFIAPSNVSPPGNDSNPGTQAAPYLTFTKIAAILLANCPSSSGCTVNLLNGTYNTATGTGFPNFTCGSNVPNGTSSAQITIQAFNSRQAFLQGDGTAEPFKMTNCTYWNIIGLHAESGDFVNEPPVGNTGSGGNVFEIITGTHLTVQGNIGAHNNRYKNCHIFAFEYSSSNNLVIGNEAYYFHRAGFMFFGGSNSNEIKQNYANSEGYPNITNGYYNNGLAFAFHVYGSFSNTIENNIAEGALTVGFNNEDNAGTGPASNNWYGNIGNALAYGARSDDHSGYATLASEPNTTAYYNLAVVNPTSVGVYFRSSYSMSCTNCSLFGTSPAVYGFAFDADTSAEGDNIFTGHAVSNSLAINFTTGTGYLVNESAGGTWSGAFTNYLGFNNGTNFSISSFSSSGQSTTNPVMGTCYMWVPSGSPIAGSNIGSTNEFLYSGGTITANPEWSSLLSCKNGQVDCFISTGVIVAGLNDTLGQSLFDVGNRLNVNKNSCAYNSGFTPAQ